MCCKWLRQFKEDDIIEISEKLFKGNEEAKEIIIDSGSEIV